ncbi:MAG: hydroxylamine oxidoreductase [Magnetococcales bacterium]|nr:hydroxylamine oxidoreductase [Magnetococcales bacterium]MBF0322465.1 hydroxylamine oxidoreductase [Magnetococcales bacterium]
MRQGVRGPVILLLVLVLALALAQVRSVAAAAETKGSDTGTKNEAVHAAKAEAKGDATDRAVRRTFDALSKESATCVSCHTEDNRGLYQQWGRSRHYGANVGCYECHRAEPGDPDAFMHKKFLISVMVTPKDCGRCHEGATREFGQSVHARAGEIEGSMSHTMATVVQGMPEESMRAAGQHGCVQCHGSKVKVKPSGKLDATSWPNSGVGRINPDGSKGACSACHQRHEFSLVQARHPDTCGKCHVGPVHAQKEIYGESKHGINFYANQDRMNVHSSKWIPGEDYDVSPTCATCHMSATVDAPLSHDVSQRISWDLRAPVSFKVGKDSAESATLWKENRKRMQAVCSACHLESIIGNFYQQFDNVVILYNDKFGKPGQELMESLLREGLRTPADFDESIEWTWFEIWHHAGRRVRQGASMQAPDFVQWRGFYEISQLFYTQLIPQAEALMVQARAAGKNSHADAVAKVLQEILSRPEHAWFLKSSGPKQEKAAP